MKIRLGYACLSKTIDITTSSTITYTNYLKCDNKEEKLDSIIKSNLEDLEKIIDYNYKNNIHFYRLSSKIIPLATHTNVDFEYISKYKNYYDRIANKIKKYNIRVDFHPDQFTVLNSTKKDVLENTFKILEYHYNLLDSLKIKNKVLILHIGSNTFGKKNSINRFVNNFNKLPEKIKKSIAVENDDKTFTIEDCVQIYDRIKTPIILDYHHYICNPSDIDYDKIFESWKGQTPKIHFSSPKNKTKKDFRSHHDYINSDDFISFIDKIKNYNIDIDIMIEAKAKDEALFKLVRELKYKTNYEFIDETSFIVK